MQRDGSRAQYFSEKDRRIYTLAQIKSQSLGLEADEACQKYAELKQRLKTGKLEEMVEFFNASPRPACPTRCAAMAGVYEEYVQYLTKRGVGTYHLLDVKRFG